MLSSASLNDQIVIVSLQPQLQTWMKANGMISALEAACGFCRSSVGITIAALGL